VICCSIIERNREGVDTDVLLKVALQMNESVNVKSGPIAWFQCDSTSCYDGLVI